MATDGEGHSTPRASAAPRLHPSLLPATPPPNPLRFDPDQTAVQPPTRQSTSSSNDGNGVAIKSNGVIGGIRSRRQTLLQTARGHELVDASSQLQRLNGDVIKAEDPQIKEDILRMIEQYLGDEGYVATKLVLHDEANIKGKERDERANEGKKLRRAILDGDWSEVDQIVSKPLVRTQKALLYALYKQQFLEHIEYRELQKAFTLLNKRLKPLEHFQPHPNEFRDLCYLLSAKSVHDAPSFRNWEGVNAARERLCDLFGGMVDGEKEDREDHVFVPPARLVTMLGQAVSYQIELARYRPKEPPPIRTLLRDYTPFIVPNKIDSVLSGHSANVKAVRFVGENGELLVSGSSDNTVRLWDTQTSRCRAILTGHTSRVWDVDANAEGSRIASASGDRTVKVWNWLDETTGTSKCVRTLEGNNGDVYAARWHPMGNHIASGGYDKIVRMFDVESGTILKTFTGHSLSISSVMFNPLGNLIVSGSKDSHVRFWDSVSGLCIRTLNAQLGEVTSVDMNDVYLLTSSRDNSIRLWDVRMLRPLRRYKAHSNTSHNFVRASFAHSSLLVSGSEDGILYMWDRESSDVLQTLEGHEGVVYGAMWHDKQSLLASYGTENTIRTWKFDEKASFEFEDIDKR